MSTVAIIIPYFGQFPPQFKFWWATALKNESITFHIITDNQEIKSEKNIYVSYISWSECKELIQSHFDFKIALPSPYKLCDFRPIYGKIFQQDINGANFWGFGDIDLIYGDIGQFITENVLQNYDLISGWGHLTLVRNNDYWNNFYKIKQKGCPDYTEVLSDPKNRGFDEYWHGGFADKAKLLHRNKVWDIRPFDDLTIPQFNLNFESDLRCKIENSNLMYEYNDGVLFRVYNILNTLYKEPIMYMHFKRRQSLLQIETNNTKQFLIIPNRFIDWQPLNIDKIKTFTKKSFIKQSIFKISLKIQRLKQKLK